MRHDLLDLMRKEAIDLCSCRLAAEVESAGPQMAEPQVAAEWAGLAAPTVKRAAMGSAVEEAVRVRAVEAAVRRHNSRA